MATTAKQIISKNTEIFKWDGGYDYLPDSDTYLNAAENLFGALDKSYLNILPRVMISHKP